MLPPPLPSTPLTDRQIRAAVRRWCDRCRAAGDHYTKDHGDVVNIVLDGRALAARR